VEYALKVDSQQILTFCMGKNTPERKDCIVENPGSAESECFLVA
jgi:hypothetical protein